MSLDINAAPILEKALEKAGQMSELYLEESTSLVIVMDDGKIEKVIGGVERGAGLRLIHDLRTSYGFTNRITDRRLLEMAGDMSLAAAGEKRPLQPAAMLKPGLVAGAVKPFADTETARKVDLVRAAEAAARAYDPKIVQVRVMYLEKLQKVRIVNSLGVEAEDIRPLIVTLVHCVAADGSGLQTGYESMGGLCGLELFDQKDPETLARQAARLAVMTLSAEPAPGGSMPVVLHSSAGGTMIHEAVGHGLEADIVLEGMSVYQDKIGQQVASSMITVLDDATLPGRRGSFGFDDEGTPSKKNVLIDKGVLQGYMQDRLSAMKMDAAPTGNGRRESYRDRPIPRMTNTMIAPGDQDPESIISETTHGLLVKKMGGGQVNTVNGDFVFEVSEGYLIKDGKVGAPVRGATLTGNGPEVLMQIDRVGSDLGFGIGTCGKDGQGAPVADAQPTLRIPNIVVGGVHQG